MWTRAAIIGLLAAGPVSAEAPLSAIDWLSRSVEMEQRSVLPGTVTVEPIVTPQRAIGFAPPASSRLAAGLWSGSEVGNLVDLLDRMPADMPLPLRDALVTLMTAAAAADDLEGTFLLARIDALLALGRIDAARRLSGLADQDSPEVFRRAFDIALLTGHEDAECRKLRSRPGISVTYQARIFCLARLGDWQAASLTLDTAKALSVLTPDQVAILGRFLNDGEDDALPPPERPETITPLVFRLYEAIGAPLVTRSLPLAFAHADLRHQNGWKTRLDAGERLYRAGAVSGETLLALYLEREPAASGALWDRVSAVRAWYGAAPADKVDAAATAIAVLAPAGLDRLVGPDLAFDRVANLDADIVPDADLSAMIAGGRRGEAALYAILRATEAWDGDPDDLARALAALKAVGLDLSDPGEAPQWAANR